MQTGLAHGPCYVNKRSEIIRTIVRRLPSSIRSTLRLLASSRARKDFTWSIRDRIIRLSLQSTDATNHKIFREIGFVQQVLPKTQIDNMLSALRNARHNAFRIDDCVQGYWSGLNVGTPESILNRHTFFSLEGEVLDKLAIILDELKLPIQTYLGTPWRIVNLRCWATDPGAPESGPNARHVDGMPAEFYKIMIYLTPPGLATGTTEFILNDGLIYTLDGPAGTWLLFMNSQLLHRGIAPEAGTRIIIEATICSSSRNDQTPKCAGLNASYPIYPWSA